MNTSIAVCIPTYNQAEYLKQSVHSVFSQTRLPDEVWISDDASTDNTPQVAQELCSQYPSIKYFRQEHNLGMGGNPNWLMRQPKTDFVAKLDSDDFYESTFLEKLIDQLAHYPRAGYAHAAVREIDEKSHIKRERRLAPRPEYIDADESLHALVKGYRVAANIILFRREALESVNFWKPDMSFADDWDLAVRLAHAGWGNCHCPEILADYRVWSDTGGYRRSRKLSEINGIRRVFDESLTPAFTQRDWDTRPITTARHLFAEAQAKALLEYNIDDHAKTELVHALQSLGNSTRLRLLLRLSRYRILSIMYLKCGQIKLRTKDAVKRAIKRS